MTAKNLSINPLLALFQNRARFLEKIATRAGSRLLEDNPAKLLNLQRWCSSAWQKGVS